MSASLRASFERRTRDSLLHTTISSYKKKKKKKRKRRKRRWEEEEGEEKKKEEEEEEKKRRKKGKKLELLNTYQVYHSLVYNPRTLNLATEKFAHSYLFLHNCPYSAHMGARG